MEPSQTIMIVAFLILIMLSAFFSSAETSFMAVSKIRIKTLAEEENSRRAQLVQKLLDNNEQLLSTILVGNNLVNIAASSLTTSLVERMVTIFSRPAMCMSRT